MADSLIASGTAPQLLGVWLHDPLSPATTERNWPHTSGAAQVDVEEELIHFVGRRYPVLESGELEDEHVDQSIVVPMGPDRRAGVAWWHAMKRAGRTLMYRDGRGRAFKAAILGRIADTDTRAGSTIQVTFQRVDWPAAATLAASDYAPGVVDDGGKGDGGAGLRGKGL